MTTETQTAEIDDFDALFAQFATKEEEPAQATETPAPAEQAAAEPAEAETTEETTAPAEETTEEPEETTEEPEEATEETPQTDDDLLNRLAALVKKADPAPQQTQQAQQAQQPEEPPPFTPEESEFLNNYVNDWPDVARAEALRRRAEYQQLLSYVFQEVAKEFKPVMEAVQVLSERTHLSDLQTAVSDYGDVRDKVIAWVDTQPAYLQTAYKHVINSGTVEEVADLVDRYKRETGVTQRAAPVQKKVTELPPATKQAAAELAPVSSKRSAVVQTADPNDFEAAFSTFADKL